MEKNMKKLIFALLFAFSTVAAFAYDYREVIFGNESKKAPTKRL